MERLTMIDGCGNDEIARCMNCGLGKAGENLENCGMCEEGWQRALRRLAAYEDTGLEPEEINDMALEVATLKTIESMYDGLGKPDHIRDLLQAEQDGRLVALPCKVGDVIRFVSEDKQGYTRYEVISFNVDQGETFIVASCKPGSARLFSVNDIGKTVFLTREEAEAALKGGDSPENRPD